MGNDGVRHLEIEVEDQGLLCRSILFAATFYPLLDAATKSEFAILKKY